MAVSVRTRFEVFKRDGFLCGYCGRKSPDVVLEVDHIVPVCEGGGDDVVNLRTACWECNRGKAGLPLSQVVTGEDPHDRAIILLEKERQLREYNAVLQLDRDRREGEAWDLFKHWYAAQGMVWSDDQSVSRQDWNWLFNTLSWCPSVQIQIFMDLAVAKNMTKTMKYVAACCRNWRYEHAANKDWKNDGDY